jgi:signal transduction histidine kinase
VTRLGLAGTLIVAAVFAPLLLFGSVVRQTLERDVVARSADERLVAARIAAASIDRELRAAGDSLVLFASAPTVRAAVRDRDGRVLDRGLADLLRGRAGSLGAVFDPAGIVLAAPLARELVGQDFSARDYFQGAMRSADPYVSEIFASASAGNPSVVGVSFAIREGDEVLGAVVLTLAPAGLLDLLRPLRQVEGRELLIVDKAGRVVASTDPAFTPLAPTGLATGAAAPSMGDIEIAGRQRVTTTGSVGQAEWTLYVIDDPAVVLAGQRELVGQLRTGSLGVAFLALVSAAAVVLLYRKTARQRDELRASRAALAETNRALQEASRHKSDFLASMSHELRTPLNAVLGFSDLLVEQLGERLTPAQRRYLGNIKDAGDHLLDLINEVLDLAKVEAGRLEIRQEPIRLATLFEPVLAAATRAAATAGLELISRYPEDVVVRVDPGRMRQIMYNLLSNAVKFTPKGRVELCAEARGSQLDVEVRDTGIGIPQDKKDRVFGTFERLHEGRSDASGTGLGLALTKKLVELHGGTISFDSAEGRGSTFRASFPDAVTSPIRGPRILVVEDERRDAELLAALAGRLGVATEIVATAASARDAVHRDAPLAMVLDLRLPDERGEALLRDLKEDLRTRSIPVLVVSVEDDEGRSRLLGAEDHLTKPIDRERVSAWIRQHVVARTEVATPAS